jgi:hypothetical protein
MLKSYLIPQSMYILISFLVWELLELGFTMQYMWTSSFFHLPLQNKLIHSLSSTRTWRFNNAQVCHRTWSWDSSIHSWFSQPLPKIHLNDILPSCPLFSTWMFPKGFITKILYALLQPYSKLQVQTTKSS